MLQLASDAKIHAASHQANAQAGRGIRRNDHPATPFEALLDELAAADQAVPEDSSEATPASAKPGAPTTINESTGIARAASAEEAASQLDPPPSQSQPEPAPAAGNADDVVATIPVQPNGVLAITATDAGDAAKTVSESKPKEPMTADDGESHPVPVLALLGASVQARPPVPAAIPMPASDPTALPPIDPRSDPVAVGAPNTAPLIPLLARFAPSRPTADAMPDDHPDPLPAQLAPEAGLMAADTSAPSTPTAAGLPARPDIRADAGLATNARRELRIDLPAELLDNGGKATTTGVDSMLPATLNASVQTAAMTTPAVATPVPSGTAAPAAPVPLTALAVEIAGQALAGKNRFEIRLDPPELGRIEVKLDVHRDGRIASHIVVDRAETLDLLRSDASALQRALQDAGLKTTDNGLQFSLRQQGGEQQQPSNWAAPSATDDAGTAPPDPLPLRLFVRDGGIDIRV